MQLGIRNFFIIIILIIKSWESLSITTRIEQSVRITRHTPPLTTDWELGLREAVYQTFLREHHATATNHQYLRDQLLEAPIIGRQNIATPFGDIAVLARGQLYGTPHGYQFVQDPYQNDCDGCHHTIRCTTCQQYPNGQQQQQLLALWTVKRIRHRDPNYGHVFEIEYTISPIHQQISENNSGGQYNYNIPGHVFVIKSNPRLNSAYYLNNNAEKHHKYSGSERGGIIIGITPDGLKHELHNFPPGFYPSYRPNYHSNNNNNNNIDLKEYELYKKLVESLASKTSSSSTTSTTKLPHRFAITTTSTLPATQPTTYQQIEPTFIPIPQTTLYQLSDGNLIPPPENIITTTMNQYQVPITTSTTTTIKQPIFTTTTMQYKYSEPELFYGTERIPTTPKPVTLPITTVHYYTPIEEEPAIPTTLKQTTPIPQTTVLPTTAFSTIPIKTTTIEELPSPITTTIQFTSPQTTTTTKKYPQSINEQLPPSTSEKNLDTTIPYIRVTSTTGGSNTQPTTEKLTTFNEIIPETTKSTYTTNNNNIYQTNEYTTVKLISTTPQPPTTTIKEQEYDESKTNTQPPQFISTQFTTDTTTVAKAESTTPLLTTLIMTTASMELTNDTTLTEIQSTTPLMTTMTTTTTTTTTMKPRKKYSRKTKAPSHKLSTSTKASDFFVDPSDKTYTPDNKQPINDDDIFGQQMVAQIRRPIKPTKSPPIKKITMSDLEEALFGGGNRRSKQIKLTSIPITTPTTKVIYSNFFEASTPSNNIIKDKDRTGRTTDLTTEIRPYTDQSVSTSITFEVNKRENKQLDIGPTTIRQNPTSSSSLSSETDIPTKNMTTMPFITTTTTTTMGPLEMKQVFDQLALQLVNHARTINYLNRKKKLTQQAKYRRRTSTMKKRNLNKSQST